MSLSAGFSLCSDRMLSACTSGRPALIIVENWRVKMTMSRIPIEPDRIFFWAVPSSTLMTCSFCLLSCFITSSRLGASIVACCIWPLMSRAVYVNVGIPAPGLVSNPYPSRLLLHRSLAILGRRHAHHAHELTLVARGADAVVGRDLLGHVELVQRIVHRLHAELLAGLHRRIDLVDLVVADERADGAGHHEDLGGHHAAAADFRQQGLRDDALETEREL